MQNTESRRSDGVGGGAGGVVIVGWVLMGVMGTSVVVGWGLGEMLSKVWKVSCSTHLY